MSNLRDRRYVLAKTTTDDLIANLIATVTGDRVDATGLSAHVGFRMLVLVTRPTMTGAEVVERLRKIVARMKADAEDHKAARDAEAEREAREIAEKLAESKQPQQLGDVAKRVVTRLRDLTGFGEARDWGMQLAQDLRSYKAGEIGFEDVDCGVLLQDLRAAGRRFSRPRSPPSAT